MPIFLKMEGVDLFLSLFLSGSDLSVLFIMIFILFY